MLVTEISGPVFAYYPVYQLLDSFFLSLSNKNEAAIMASTIAHPMVIAVLDPVVQFLQSLAFIGEDSHVVKLAFIDSKIQPIADSLGMGLPLIKVCHERWISGWFSWVIDAVFPSSLSSCQSTCVMME